MGGGIVGDRGERTSHRESAGAGSDGRWNSKIEFGRDRLHGERREEQTHVPHSLTTRAPARGDPATMSTDARPAATRSTSTWASVAASGAARTWKRMRPTTPSRR